MNEIISVEEYLDKNGELTYSNVGRSMLPLLREGKDLFTVRKKGTERCAAGDVVLYRNGTDRFILHRIIKVRKDDYIILGDNSIKKEYGIKDTDIIGVMTGYFRSGKSHTVDEPGYRLYSFVRLYTADIRIFFKRIYSYLIHILKKDII